MGRHQSTKLFDNYTVSLRQHKAQHSHCQLLHGYALKFDVVFEAETLDDMNWVVDFGGFGHMGLKDWMNNMFDHTMLIEHDDPLLDIFVQLGQMGAAKVHIMQKMGCESLAKLVFDKFNDALSKQDGARAWVVSVRCYENDKNSAIYLK